MAKYDYLTQTLPRSDCHLLFLLMAAEKYLQILTVEINQEFAGIVIFKIPQPDFPIWRMSHEKRTGHIPESFDLKQTIIRLPHVSPDGKEIRVIRKSSIGSGRLQSLMTLSILVSAVKATYCSSISICYQLLV